mmetsp:Transcript_28250/g.60435  ORF Transcript_28250/g.60435 Transcript_28250/m.60435 type:complete len:184 (-) Transcript_28250:1085-1636(-)
MTSDNQIEYIEIACQPDISFHCQLCELFRGVAKKDLNGIRINGSDISDGDLNELLLELSQLDEPVKYFEFKELNFTRESIESLSKVLTNYSHPLEKVVINSCALGNERLGTIIDAFMDMRIPPSKLHLHNNNISDEGCIKVSELTSKSNFKLAELSFLGNSGITYKGLRHIFSNVAEKLDIIT